MFPYANGSNPIRQGPEKVEEHSSDHPGEEDESDLAKQQDAMQVKLYPSRSCSRATKMMCGSRKLI